MNKLRKLRGQADELFKLKIINLAMGECEVCGSDFGITAHHFFPRSLAGHLHYYIPNGVCLCRGCHFAHHFKSDPAINETIIRKRGRKWYQNLLKRKKEQHISFKNQKYYLGVIKDLS